MRQPWPVSPPTNGQILANGPVGYGRMHIHNDPFGRVLKPVGGLVTAPPITPILLVPQRAALCWRKKPSSRRQGRSSIQQHPIRPGEKQQSMMLWRWYGPAARVQIEYVWQMTGSSMDKSRRWSPVSRRDQNKLACSTAISVHKDHLRQAVRESGWQGKEMRTPHSLTHSLTVHRTRRRGPLSQHTYIEVGRYVSIRT